METHPNMNLVTKMLDDALCKLQLGEYPILHSDQGWQYQMVGYQSKLEAVDVKHSMYRNGNCLDNEVVENFFGLLKSECWFNE
ncbi:integrase core domain protein [Vibrio cholerae]|nr:integrase core domain protein [Vibrio cholerae]GHY94637.1 integrase core domain protein [Vibrio cholerae]